MSKKKSPSEKLSRYRIEKKLIALEKLVADLREMLNPTRSKDGKRVKVVEITPQLQAEILDHIRQNPGCSLMDLQRRFSGGTLGDSWARVRMATIQFKDAGLITIRHCRRRNIRHHYIKKVKP